MANEDGARFSWADISHATDLARLAKHMNGALSRALAAQRGEPGSDRLRVIRVSRGAGDGLPSPGFFMGSILDGLSDDEDFRRMCRSGEFVEGCSDTKKGQASCVGGRIRKDTESSLHSSLATMRRTLGAAFQEFGASLSAAHAGPMVIEAGQVRQWLSQVAGGMSPVYGLQEGADADIHSVRLRDAPLDPEHGKAVGVHVVATEESPSRESILAQLRGSLSEWFLARGDTRDQDHAEDVADSVHKWMQQADIAGSDMEKFVDFLRSDILARVRLAVTMMIMERLSEAQADEASAFREYSTRIVQVFRQSVDADRPRDVSVDIQAVTGASGTFSLLDVIVSAEFWERLPVISSWEFPAMEDEDRGSGRDRREVSYAFKVNGDSPRHPKERGGFKSSYQVQVEGAIGHLGDAARPPDTRRRALAFLLLMDALLPRSGAPRTDDPLKAIEERVKALAGKDASAVASFFSRRLLGDGALRDDGTRSACVGDVDRIALGAVAAVWSSVGARSRTDLLKEASRPQTYQITVRDGMIDPAAIGAQRLHPLLLVADKGRDKDFKKVEWLKMVRVIRSSDGTRLPSGAGRLLSLEARVSIRLRIAYDRACRAMRSERILDRVPVVTAAFLPRYSSHGPGGRHGHETAAFALLKAQRAGRPGLTLTYGVEQLAMAEPFNEEEGQAYAARAAAMTILSLLALDLFLDGAEAGAGAEGMLHAMLFRLQFRAADEDVQPGTAEHVAYAASQAVEHALSRRVTTKLQGMASSSRTDSDLDMRRSKSFLGLLSGFGVRTPSAVAAGTKVGFVFFASRPCDSKGWSMDSSTSHAVFGRSYVAEFDGEQVSVTRVPGSSRVHTGDAAAALSESVGSMVRRLASMGCSQVAIVSHAHGSLTLDKTRSRRAQGHDNRRFLHDLYAAYPDLTFYHLMCGTQRMMRGKGVLPNACHEARGLESHFDSGATDLRANPTFSAGLRPLYSIGTMKVVGQKRRQSGFMTYHLVRLDDGASETPGALRAVNALADGPQQAALLDALRAIHFMEYEGGFPSRKSVPILEPMSWMKPSSVAGAGEVMFMGDGRSKSRKGKVSLSLTAVAARTAAVLDGLRDERQEQAPV